VTKKDRLARFHRAQAVGMSAAAAPPWFLPRKSRQLRRRLNPLTGNCWRAERFVKGLVRVPADIAAGGRLWRPSEIERKPARGLDNFWTTGRNRPDMA